ncbi:MAG: type II toxin-antitoxin system PemK/MazF family toxin [Bacillota bacterium]|nr:type II toxin-antitoxin system PemK/MazF family toxin [Bacillota bacterium]
MKYSDILVKHVYTVIFDPVRECEFDDTHLAVVIKKNNDKKSVIVMPLTTSPNGDGINKINIGRLSDLPEGFKKEDSFAVYNQVRTVNYTRFIALKGRDGNVVSVKIEDEVFFSLLSLCFDDLLYSLVLDEKLDFCINQYSKFAVKKAVNAAYNIKRLLKKEEDTGAEIRNIKSEINSLLCVGIDYDKYISEVDYQNGIADIIDSCLEKNVLTNSFRSSILMVEKGMKSLAKTN